MPPYCWQIPSLRLNGKQAEESKGLLTACSSFWYEIWPSFWYDGGKKSTFLEFRYFFTYNISRKTNEFSIRNDIWLSFRNLQFEIWPLFDMIYDCHFEMRGTKIWLSLWYDTGSGSLWIRVPEPKIFWGLNFNLQIFVTKQIILIHKKQDCCISNFRLQNLSLLP